MGIYDLRGRLAAFRTRRKLSARVTRSCFASFLIGTSCILTGAAQEVLTVLSSDSGYYMDSLSGFEKEWGSAVPSATMTRGGVIAVPRGTRVVAAFGAKAALRPYPEDVLLIYWAPGLAPEQIAHSGLIVKIRLTPRPDALISRLKELQPGLKRLRAFYISRDFTRYTEDLRSAAAALGLDFRAEPLRSADDLPQRLRDVGDKTDALWVAPDPMLVNPVNFMILRNYSLANGVPLYVPSPGLVEQGATASVMPDFGEVGRITARAVRKFLTYGETPAGGEAYPELVEITLNLTAASKTGLAVDQELLSKVKKAFP